MSSTKTISQSPGVQTISGSRVCSQHAGTSSSITSIVPISANITNSISKYLRKTPPTKMRMFIPHKNGVFHFSRVSSEEEAKLVLELLSSPDKPKQLNSFPTPIAILRTKKENLYSPVECIYMVCPSAKNYSSIKKTRFSKYRIKIVGKLVSILASLHSIGILAGDTTVENIAVKNNIQPIFRSSGHMKAMNKMGEGISEFLLLLCNLLHVGSIVPKELIHLIRHYLASNKEAYLHAKYYLHGQKEKTNKSVDEALKSNLLNYYSKYFA